MNVEWIPQSEYAYNHIPRPQPAKNFIPDWYKSIPPFETGHSPKIHGTRANSTEKMCMPLMDTFTTGYIQELSCDIYVDKTDAGITLYQSNDAEDVFKIGNGINRSEEAISPGGYLNISASWWTRWEPKTPRGWSTLYTHPLNQYNSPFFTMSGIIDTDKWWHGGAIPFFIREGFEGIIPKGTPIYQMVFFKREDWNSKTSKYSEQNMRSLYDSVFNSFYGGYKKLKWSKKNYD